MKRVATASASKMIKAFILFTVTEEEDELIDEGTMGVSSSSAEHVEDHGPPELSQIEVEEVASNVENIINQYFTVSSLHLRCPIHMLQLAIKDAINEHDSINTLPVKVESMVRSVRKSTLNTEQTDSLGVRPTIAHITRWNSQLKMIGSVL